MKKILLVLFIIGLAAVVGCLKPQHSNEWDPDNPDKATLVGTVEGPEGKIGHALVTLLIDDELYDTTRTDAEGEYRIDDIDPGIYKVTAKALLFTPVEFFPESLPAGILDTVYLYMCEHLFNFDDVALGTTEPYDFSAIEGNWAVVEDNGQPGEHTIPNVYNCTGYMGVALYNPPIANGNIAAMFKINGPADSTLLETGFVVRMQDSLNYYLVSVTPQMVHFFVFVNGTGSLLGGSLCDVPLGSWHYLYVDACDQTFSIYLDYELKIEVTDNTYSQGLSGLWCAKEALPVNVSFDDVTICQ